MKNNINELNNVAPQIDIKQRYQDEVDAKRRAKITAKRNKTREANYRKRKAEAYKQLRAKMAQDRKDRLERNRSEKEAKVRNKPKSLVEVSYRSLDVDGQTSKSKLSEFMKTSNLDNISRNSRHKELYKKIVRERSKDITNPNDVDGFIKQARNIDKFIIDSKSIPKYAKIINQTQDGRFVEEGISRGKAIVNKSRKKAESAISSMNTSDEGANYDSYRDQFLDDEEYMYTDDFQEQSREYQVSYATSLAHAGFDMVRDDHSGAATLTIAADMGFDDTGITKLRHNYNPAKWKNPRSRSTEEMVDRMRRMEASGFNTDKMIQDYESSL